MDFIDYQIKKSLVDYLWMWKQIRIICKVWKEIKVDVFAPFRKITKLKADLVWAPRTPKVNKNLFLFF